MKKSPNSATKQQLESEGYIVEIVEHFNTFSKTRHDLFGCIDVLGVKDGEIFGIQATTKSNTSSRIKKAMGNPILPVWLTRARFEVWGWDSKRTDKKVATFLLNNDGTISTTQ